MLPPPIFENLLSFGFIFSAVRFSRVLWIFKRQAKRLVVSPELPSSSIIFISFTKAPENVSYFIAFLFLFFSPFFPFLY